MNLFSAKQARKLQKEFFDAELNFQRGKILRKIRSEIERFGWNFVTIDEELERLLVTEEDWKFFEKLGYKVERPKRTTFIDKETGKEMYRLEYGRISW